MDSALPSELKCVREAVKQRPSQKSTVDALQPTWDAYIARAVAVVPEIHIEDGGETVYSGVLSPGCQACKAGAWDCIFLTMRCNLDCAFCYSPHHIPGDYCGSALGSTPRQVAENHHKAGICGTSFSGGEPLLEMEKLQQWFAALKAERPDEYYWLYTNGLVADETVFRRLGELGLDEIRFNAAAAGYDHPTVMDNIASAVRFIPNVTVEIPAIPEHAAQLRACLALWDSLGVRYLNMHELIYEPGSNSLDFPGTRQTVIMDDGHQAAFNPQSRSLTLAVMEDVREKGLGLSVNDCSLQNKLRQLRQRRRAIALLAQANHDKLVGETYETCCTLDERGRVEWFHPDCLQAMYRRQPSRRFFRLRRVAPLSVGEPPAWTGFEEIAPHFPGMDTGSSNG